MKALILEEFNSPYITKELETPVAGIGQVLVKIAASGVNPLDIKIKAGQAAHAQAKLPAIIGIDLAGTVVQVGEGVKNFIVDDEVYGMTGGIAGVPGSLAEYAAVDADLIARKPKNLNMHNTAAIPLIFITAWEGLVDRANVGPGKNVLIHGGAGGVGHIGIQIAKARGANVFSTAAPKDHEMIKCYGAQPIDYTSLTVDEYVEAYTNGEGFDIVFDTVGGPVLDASFKAAKQYYGHVISILGWGTHHLAPLSFKGATYSGVFTLYPLITGKGRAHHAEILSEATAMIEGGRLIPNVDPIEFAPAQIEEAYQYLQNGLNKGKVVVDIAF
jgi:NADPH:quinone reductase-like Zn-dependent oxidoreductase